MERDEEAFSRQKIQGSKFVSCSNGFQVAQLNCRMVSNQSKYSLQGIFRCGTYRKTEHTHG